MQVLYCLDNGLSMPAIIKRVPYLKYTASGVPVLPVRTWGSRVPVLPMKTLGSRVPVLPVRTSGSRVQNCTRKPKVADGIMYSAHVHIHVIFPIPMYTRCVRPGKGWCYHRDREVKMHVISDVTRKFSSRYLARASKNHASGVQLTSKLVGLRQI